MKKEGLLQFLAYVGFTGIALLLFVFAQTSSFSILSETALASGAGVELGNFGSGGSGEFDFEIPTTNPSSYLHNTNDDTTKSQSMSSGLSCPAGGNVENTNAALINDSCTVNTPVTILMNAVDPQGDQIRYLIDWDGDEVVDEYSPTSGYVDSGTMIQSSQTFTTAGEHTVRFRVEDSNGALSLWSGTITFNCVDTRAPATPTVTTPLGDQCTPGVAENVTVSSTHPGGKDLFYEFDFDRNGTADVQVPLSGAVASGIPQTVSYTFENGEYAFYARAVDVDGGASSWALVTGTCGVDQGHCPACVDGIASAELRSRPSMVFEGQTTEILWTVGGLDTIESCNITGTNGDEVDWSTISSNSSFVTSPIQSQTTYTLSCAFSDVGVLTDVAQVFLVPNWQEF